MKRVVSGIQPSGVMHLGNYLGAINNWIPLQDDHQCLFFLADLHTITVAQEPSELRKNIIATAASYIASGIDPSKSIIFSQSTIPQHAELGWILSCITSMGWVERMTQFKDKAGQEKERASLGLFSYPVLQAADILLYKADLVPVGEDQRQHLELTRDIAAAFNRNIKQNYFTLPQALIAKDSARIMSLRDGLKKMSKSDPADFSRINLTDDAEIIMQKVKKAKSDSIIEIYYDKENRPDVSNLLDIYNVLTGNKINKIEGMLFSQFKQELAEIIIDKITPLGREISKLCQDEHNYIIKILKEGSEKASHIAETNIKEIKNLCGFIN